MDQEQYREILIRKLRHEGYLHSSRVARAFREVRRENFVPREERDLAYSDRPLSTMRNQTISAPHMVAIMTELLNLKENNRVLEIGAGSGYQAAVLSRLAKKVYTVEFEKDLVKFAQRNLKKTGIRNVSVIHGDGREGYRKAAPYDRVIVTCAVPRIYDELVQQLKPGGIIVAPVGGDFLQTLVSGKKVGEKLKLKEHFNCVFVPMRH
jgi:protein-L-isoaspartate(D-aspartate) O-methyltransferase